MTRIAVYGAGGVGFVVRRAAQHALAVPMSEAVYAILQPWAIRNQGEAGS